jgi:zinc/manganese transport system substrate-binding protein
MIRLVVSSLLFSLAFVATRPAAAEITVVATVPTLAAIAREIAGDAAKVSSLALHTQDPHFVDPKPSLALQLHRADLLLSVGLGLEIGWLPTLQQGARNPKILAGARGHLDCSTLVEVLDVAPSADRSEGDIHPGGNPHYLYDPRRIGRVAAGVGARLAALDPDRAEHYRKRSAALLARLDEARRVAEEKLARLRGAAVVTYHRSWTYLSDWLGLREIGHVEPKPGIPPTPQHVASLIAAARRAQVKLVLEESFYPSDTARIVAEKAGAAMLVLPSGPDFRGGESVLAWLATLVRELERGLSS